MKSFLSFLSKVSNKKRFLGTERLESYLKKQTSPFDRVLLGIFALVMISGALTLFISASLAVSLEVPAKGGTHIEGVIGTPRFINPLLATSETDSDLTELVFGGLLKAHSDGTLSPNLAESVEVSPDKLSYTFTLRSDITFHDGKPVTAEDVVFTIQAAKNPEIKSPRRANWEGVEVVAIDERTVLFTLKAPYALFLENATMGILPKHVWQFVRPEEFPFSELNLDPIGTGSFRVDSIKKNSSGVPTEYRLRAYDKAPSPAFIQTFVFRFFVNQDTLAQALQNGTVDAAHSLIPQSASNSQTHEAVFGRVFGVFFNQNQNQIFSNKVVRRALDASLDKKAIVDTILSGYGTPLSGPLPPTGVELSLETESGEKASLDEARAILESDGWKRDEESGTYTKKTKGGTESLSFSLATGNVPELKQAAELVASRWRELGAQVELQFFDTNDLNLEIIRPRKYDALLFGLVVGRELDLFAFWHASQRNDPGLNIALYANIVTDSLLEEAREEEDPILRREKAAEAAEEITKDVAAVFLYAPHFLYITEDELKGVHLGTISTPSDRFFGVEDWYLKTESLWPLFK